MISEANKTNAPKEPAKGLDTRLYFGEQPRRCSNCVWFALMYKGSKDTVLLGECRAMAPVGMGFPIVRGGDPPCAAHSVEGEQP